MAENQTLILPKEEKRETEGEIVDEKPPSVFQNDGETDRCVDEPATVHQASQSETLVDTFHSQELDVKPTVTPEIKTEQFATSHQKDLTCVTAQAEGQMQVQSGHPCSSMELLPVPIKQSLSSTITPSPLRQRPPILEQDSNVPTAEVNHENSSDNKMELAHNLAKPLSPDGYNWRKYGQKPVKSNDSSRSYYRCTYSSCHAKKKVERCDHSGSVVEIIYKGEHNHDPPRKVRRTKARCFSTAGAISSPEPGEGSEIVECPTRELDGSDPSTSGRKLNNATPEQKLHSPKDCSPDAIYKAEEDCDRKSAKRRKGGSVASPDPLCKTIKEPKVVVQASGDLGMGADGYRWRKYGQKMVKGNSNPRSYYKCTSAGCPVRKHVERAADDATIMITYEGKHDHDMPVPKKNPGPPSDALPITATTAINSAELKESEPLVHPESSTQCSMDVEREVVNEKAPEYGGGKALESARTLLSIGIELRPY